MWVFKPCAHVQTYDMSLYNSHLTVITYVEQPANVSAVVMGQAYFPCRYTGTNKVPEWNIIDSNGLAMQYTATTLPSFHFYNGTGLLITKVDASLNLTTYSCFFDLDRAGPYTLASSNGTLNILTPVIFKMNGVGGVEPSNELSFIEGMSNSFITINQSGYTNLTFIVTLEIELLQGNLEGMYHNMTYSMLFVINMFITYYQNH